MGDSRLTICDDLLSCPWPILILHAWAEMPAANMYKPVSSPSNLPSRLQPHGLKGSLLLQTSPMISSLGILPVHGFDGQHFQFPQL